MAGRLVEAVEKMAAELKTTNSSVVAMIVQRFVESGLGSRELRGYFVSRELAKWGRELAMQIEGMDEKDREGALKALTPMERFAYDTAVEDLETFRELTKELDEEKDR